MSLVNSDTATGGTRRRRASARRRRGRLATGPRPLNRIAAAGSVVVSPSSSPTALCLCRSLSLCRAPVPFSLSLSALLCLVCVLPPRVAVVCVAGAHREPLGAHRRVAARHRVAQALRHVTAAPSARRGGLYIEDPFVCITCREPGAFRVRRDRPSVRASRRPQ